MKTFYIRTASAAVFLIIMVGCIFAPFWIYFCILMGFVLNGSIKEYYKIISPKYHARHPIWQGALYRLCIIVPVLFAAERTRPNDFLGGLAFGDIYTLSFFTVAICAFIAFLLELFNNSANPFADIGYQIVPLFWIVIPIQFILLIYFDKGSWFVLSIFSIIWFYDSACYIVGSLIGKHKMIERISPKKTWEGLAGGVVLTLTGAFFINKIPQLNMYAGWQWVILAFVIIVAATFGDLVESLFKRGFGIKDSGTMMPGHGGYLDRFDAFFFAVPFASLAIFLLDKFK